jgi:glycine/D-amino acid oxidase-like deaminating enzyme
VIYGDGFDYITQLRPEEDGAPQNQGDLMIGGGFARTVKDGVDMVGVSDDAEPLEGLTVAHISGVFPAVFSPNWGVGGGLKEAWSGILGFTGDLMPLVGRLDTNVTGRVPSNDTEPKTGGMPAGEWIMAGFSGEGMVWSWLCGMALGLKMAGHDDDEELTFPGRPNGRVGDWFPDELWVSEKRLKSADASNLPSQM